MSHVNEPKISVIIPVYNGAEFLYECLSCVANQTYKANEIIVVDNNCSDDSIKIAKSFKNVTIIKEPKQGLSYARNAGFNYASGDILVRIDDDTYAPSDYLQNLVKVVNNNPNFVGFSGYGTSRYEFIPKISLLLAWGYYSFTKAYLGYPVMFGANMAFKASYWPKVKPLLLNNDLAVHEDQDLSLALISVGGNILLTRQLNVTVQMRAFFSYYQYRKYGLMLHLLKLIDKTHPRSSLSTRLPKINRYKRVGLWLISAWGVYLFYALVLFRELLIKLKFIAR